MPILLAVPANDLTILSILSVFISAFLISAISFKSSFDMLQTLFLFDSAEPFLILLFHFIRLELTGLLRAISKLLSIYTVTSTGIFTSKP